MPRHFVYWTAKPLPPDDAITLGDTRLQTCLVVEDQVRLRPQELDRDGAAPQDLRLPRALNGDLMLQPALTVIPDAPMAMAYLRDV
jgi:hypothetical protein